MFLIDKYNINDISDIEYNKFIYKELLKLDNLYCNTTKNRDLFDKLPNLFLCSSDSNGKSTLVNMLLNKIYGEVKTKLVSYTIVGYGSNKLEKKIKQSLYHIEIEPTGSGLDKYLVNYIIKKYAEKHIINFKNNKTFKIIWIHNIHKFSYYAQTALRCTMEKYLYTCKFILTGTDINKVIKPLRSRCLIIKLPLPSKHDMLNVLLKISFKENQFLKLKDYNEIVNNCTTIKDCIWYLNTKYLDIEYEERWKGLLNDIIKLIKNLTERNIKLNDTIIIRKILYKIFITNITDRQILKELLKQLLKEFKYLNINHEIINISTKSNKCLIDGKRSIIHLESFIFQITSLLLNKIKK